MYFKQFYRHILIYQQCIHLSSNDNTLLEDNFFNIRINTGTYYSVNVRSTSKNLQGRFLLFFSIFFFFSAESAPLLACSEHRCTRQKASLHAEEKAAALQTCHGASGYSLRYQSSNRQSLQPKAATCADPFHYNKTQNNTFLPVAFLLLFTTPTRWLVNSEGNLCSLVRCISSPIISFSGSITYYRVWLKEKYWCCAYNFVTQTVIFVE